MIKNIIFDLGGVVIDFKPENYLEYLGFDRDDIKLFSKIVFKGEEWTKCDLGNYTIFQVEEKLLQDYPQYSDKFKKIFSNLDYDYILFEKKETSNYLKELADRGYNIYILSDLSKDCYNYNRKFNFFRFTKGGVYSFKIGSVKPSMNNYYTLLRKYNLVAEESIFIDDRKNNIDAANSIGIHGILFTDIESLKTKMSKYEI